MVAYHIDIVGVIGSSPVPPTTYIQIKLPFKKTTCAGGLFYNHHKVIITQRILPNVFYDSDDEAFSMLLLQSA